MQIRPQPGPQEQFLASSADVVIFGGGAGGGKTFAMLMEPLRHVDNASFGAVVFRRNYTQVTMEGGMWDESTNLYTRPPLLARPNRSTLKWTFPSGASVGFAHLQHDDSIYDYDGAQITLMGFDQLEQFTEKQFFYLLTRNRSTTGIKPYVRATCNPMPDHWLGEFLKWWIGDDGYVIKERCGIIRWFVKRGDTVHWRDTAQELVDDLDGVQLSDCKSCTFILATVFDNKILMERNPEYIANLKSQDEVTYKRLLGEGEGDANRGGNWHVREEAGAVYNRAWFPIVDVAPPMELVVRFWDFAATEKKLKNNAATASVLMGKARGTYYILDVTENWLGPGSIEQTVYNLATQDRTAYGSLYRVRWELEGGSSGKIVSFTLTRTLAGYNAVGIRPAHDKVTRARPLSAQARVGNVMVLRAPWNKRFIDHMHAFPEGPRLDIADAASGAFTELSITHVSGSVAR